MTSDKRNPGDGSLPERSVRVLNDFIGHLHAARCGHVVCLKFHQDPRYGLAAKYGLQIVFGTVALTMRKFEDFCEKDLPRLIPDKTKRPPEAKSLVHESRKRHLRAAANMLIAHYTNENRQLPSLAEVTALIEKGGWETDEEFTAWIRDPAIERVVAVRDAISTYHKLEAAKS